MKDREARCAAIDGLQRVGHEQQKKMKSNHDVYREASSAYFRIFCRHMKGIHVSSLDAQVRTTRPSVITQRRGGQGTPWLQNTSELLGDINKMRHAIYKI